MSDTKSTTTSTNMKRRRQAEQSTTGEDIRVGTIIVIGFISLALFGIGIGWSYAIQSGREEEIYTKGKASVPTEIGKSEIGIVDQGLFDTDRRLEIWTKEYKKRLSTFGWVDRAKGIAHMPIEAAMQQVIANPPDIAGEGVPPSGKISPGRAPTGIPTGATTGSTTGATKPGGTP